MGDPARAAFPLSSPWRSIACASWGSGHRKEQHVPTRASSGSVTNGRQCLHEHMVEQRGTGRSQALQEQDGSRAACICSQPPPLASASHTEPAADTNSRPWKHPPSTMPGNQEVTGLQDSGEQPHCPPTANFIWPARPLHYWSSFSSDFARNCGN